MFPRTEKYAGCIVISDVVKPNTKLALSELKKHGVKKTVMLTGDSKAAADRVAAEIGIDEVHSELLPAEVAEVEKLLDKKEPKEKLAFVGDGINDVPVLSRADIGIAMGALGSDAAIEAADIVLMDDDPAKNISCEKNLGSHAEDSKRKHCVCPSCESRLPCAQRSRHCKYGSRHIRRCRK